MGQQQLLLLVLGIVLVGTAVILGIDLFEQSRRISEADAMTALALDVASAFEPWYRKAPLMGGGGEGACPVEQHPRTFGFTTTDDPPPGSPDAAAGPWIDAGNGIYARLDGPRDVVQVVSTRFADLSVELQVAGPDLRCQSMRRRTYTDGTWQLESPHTGEATCPRGW